MRKHTDHLGNEYPSFSAMAEAYELSAATLNARINVYGWDMEKALTTPVMKNPKQITCKDHKGNEYPSLKAMGKAYGVHENTVYSRAKKGWDAERILSPVTSRHGIWKDHKGKQYPTQKAMAEAYGIPGGVLSARLSKGWNLESALTKPVIPGRRCKNIELRDHKGNVYPTKRALAKAYGLKDNTLAARIASGWSLEEALTTPAGAISPTRMKYKDHKGKGYPTLQSMLDAYGIKDPTFRNRLRNGYSMEEALTTPTGQKMSTRRTKYKDHKGNEYTTLKAMLDAYGIPYHTFHQRIGYGHTLEDALTRPIRISKKENQHGR